MKDFIHLPDYNNKWQELEADEWLEKQRIIRALQRGLARATAENKPEEIEHFKKRIKEERGY